METSTLNLNNLAIKARTKNELYRLLTTEANMYLPLNKKPQSILWEISFKAEERNAFIFD